VAVTGRKTDSFHPGGLVTKQLLDGPQCGMLSAIAHSELELEYERELAEAEFELSLERERSRRN
jgi:predicted secreted Zn-dependent protease